MSRCALLTRKSVKFSPKYGRLHASIKKRSSFLTSVRRYRAAKETVAKDISWLMIFWWTPTCGDFNTKTFASIFTPFVQFNVTTHANYLRSPWKVNAVQRWVKVIVEAFNDAFGQRPRGVTVTFSVFVGLDPLTAHKTPSVYVCAFRHCFWCLMSDEGVGMMVKLGKKVKIKRPTCFVYIFRVKWKLLLCVCMCAGKKAPNRRTCFRNDMCLHF